MVQINFAMREVNCKIVYYGPGRSGKTTNLEIVHTKAPEDSRGEMVSIATETDRTLFFDFLPLDLGTVAGMKTKFQLYTVPGQVYYDATRKLVLQGADGVIFVADSQKSMREENVESLENLTVNLKENGIDINEIPLVLQWNKRDLEDIDTPEYLNEYLNSFGCPAFEAVAVTGEGVFPTLKSLASLVIKKINVEQSYEADSGAASPSESQAPAEAKPESKPVEEPAEKPAAPAAAEKPAADSPPAEPAAPAAAEPVKAKAAEEQKAPAAVKASAEKKVSEETKPAPPVEETRSLTEEVKEGPAAAEEPLSKDAAVKKEQKPSAPLEETKVDKPKASAEDRKTAMRKKLKQEVTEEGKNPISAELEKRKAERQDRDREMRERIKKSARKPAGTTDWNKILIIGFLIILILGAIGAALYFTGNK
jgi:signal recognition particle receptor subunit beta